jgi:alpha-tubulin suppressor-like RCC1 family protein
LARWARKTGGTGLRQRWWKGWRTVIGRRGIEAAFNHSFAVTQSASVFHWGAKGQSFIMSSLRLQLVRGFRRVRVRRVCGGSDNAFAIGKDGELFSWGVGRYGLLGHGDAEERRSPTRVEALRGVRVRSVAG